MLRSGMAARTIDRAGLLRYRGGLDSRGQAKGDGIRESPVQAGLTLPRHGFPVAARHDDRAPLGQRCAEVLRPLGPTYAEGGTLSAQRPVLSCHGDHAGWELGQIRSELSKGETVPGQRSPERRL